MWFSFYHRHYYLDLGIGVEVLSVDAAAAACTLVGRYGIYLLHHNIIMSVVSLEKEVSKLAIKRTAAKYEYSPRQSKKIH